MRLCQAAFHRARVQIDPTRARRPSRFLKMRPICSDDEVGQPPCHAQTNRGPALARGWRRRQNPAPGRGGVAPPRGLKRRISNRASWSVQWFVQKAGNARDPSGTLTLHRRSKIISLNMNHFHAEPSVLHVVPRRLGRHAPRPRFALQMDAETRYGSLGRGTALAERVSSRDRWDEFWIYS
jgi:hypothetical protein